MPRTLLLIALIVLLFPAASAAQPSGDLPVEESDLEGAAEPGDACVAVGPGYVIVRCSPVVVRR